MAYDGRVKRTTVYLTADLKAALARRARDLGRSEAELIREGIALVVEDAAAPPRPRTPLFDSGLPGVAADLETAMDGFGAQ